ncbi:MAG: hypothetical protein M3Q32_07690, partial [Pseudomonadota bacterium]|nr:hypothetical protein [Pseudomonadota bacterium]
MHAKLGLFFLFLSLAAIAPLHAAEPAPPTANATDAASGAPTDAATEAATEAQSSANAGAQIPDTLEQRLLACAACHGKQGEGIAKSEYY